ncbi:MAG TPA: sigma-70 family RNA polymerase sigma factor [Bacteroidota bacterium]|nr:sigma-70 family RNA polymerase sigma factor [Bacteroidota bacterium]
MTKTRPGGNFPPPSSFIRVKDARQTEEDFRLIRAIQKGDAFAFEELVRRYQRQVASIIYLTMGSREEVDDLSQEVFIRVHKSLPRFEFDSSFFSWLYRITVNLCIDTIRKKKVKRILSLDFLAEGSIEKEQGGRETTQASDHVLGEEKKKIILDSLQKLSVDHRQIIILREYEDLTYKEISKSLGISIQAVKSRLFRAREELRVMLQPYFKERV